ncbi:nucleotidyltransferase [Polymorphobacter glacialis]|uniref:Nucleotidyltransferase n=1 Tax=Sandarakinorhabdus glacialis TaxID=1614636 RepID=A0A917A0W5_9SPHN|nr:nucleotidyltransferase [Polymorphobacter glacialis]
MVIAADAAARRLGVHPGMAAAMAQALVAGLIVRDADPAADAQALDRLALWLLRRYAPVVATDPPDGLMIDITGATHLFGGETATLSNMIERLAAVGITARVAVAGSYGAAHALARFHAAPITAIDAGDHAPLLMLPVAALRLPAAMIDGLRRLGFDRVGELAATPRAPLALRFGSEVGRRLDQMFGHSSEPFALIEAPELIRVRQAFAEPIAAAETIARYIAKLVDLLCIVLEERGLGARKLDLLFYRVDNACQSVRVGTARPIRDRKRITRLLCDRIETVSPGFGIETMVLSAPLAEPLDYRAGNSNLVDTPVADISELIDVLANRVGDGSLYRLAPVASDVPERSVRRVAALASEGGSDWSGEWPRPSRLFSRPERIETLALLPDHPPAAFTWRGIRRRVRRADGPERVFGEWWKRDAETVAVRDYFQVEDDAGERFWLFRAGDGEDPDTGAQNWFIHGIFG